MKRKIKITENQLRIITESVHQDQEVITEGWLQNIAAAVAMLAGVATSSAQSMDKLPYSPEKLGQLKTAMENPQVISQLKKMGVEDNNIQKAIDRLEDADSVRYRDITVKNEKQVQSLLRAGYHLTSVDVDTIFKEVAHKTVVERYEISLDLGENFGSGSFEFMGKQALIDTVTAMSKDGAIVNVLIESSTDKQRLSSRLEQKLASMGYKEGGNAALSHARNDQVKKTLIDMGISDTIMCQNFKVEQGSGVAGQSEKIVDSSARYVKVFIDIVKDVEEEETHPEVKSINKTYHMFNATAVNKPSGTYHFKGKNSRVKKLGKLPGKKYSNSGVRCKMPGH